MFLMICNSKSINTTDGYDTWYCTTSWDERDLTNKNCEVETGFT
jgi:hypothetical protein